MNETEKRAEILLKSIGREMHKERVEKFNEFDKAARHIEKNDSMTLRNKRQLRMRRLAAAAVILCISAVLLASLTVTSDAFRGKVFGFLFVEKDGYSELVKQDETADVQFVMKYPNYIPQGYEKTDEESFGDMKVLTYKCKDKDDYISITQMTEDGMTMSVDNEHSIREKCFVGICEAFYIKDADDAENENHMLIWDEKGIFYEIMAALDKETMIKIGESLE